MSKGRALALCAVVLLSACHGDANQTPIVGPKTQASAPALPAKRGPTPEELTVGMVEAVAVGKSTAPVAIKFDLAARPEVGKPFDVVLAVMPQEPAEAASLQVTASGGLQLAPTAESIDIGALDPTQVYRVSVTATPSAEGVQLLALTITLKHDDGTTARSFSVPIIVQGTGAAPAAKH